MTHTRNDDCPAPCEGCGAPATHPNRDRAADAHGACWCDDCDPGPGRCDDCGATLQPDDGEAGCLACPRCDMYEVCSGCGEPSDDAGRCPCCDDSRA